MRDASWVACECDQRPCVCFEPIPRIGPTDPAEARQLQTGLAESRPAMSAWFKAYLREHGAGLAAALSRPTGDLIREALEARRQEGGNA